MRSRAWALSLALLAAPAAAQGPGGHFSLGEGPPVVTLDQERLLAESAFGRGLAAAVDSAARALSEENRALEQALSAEELSLTERRPTLAAEEFRALADAFDDRVDEIRRRQEARGRAIGRFRDTQRQRFFEAAGPVVGQVVLDVGASVVLDSRAIVLAVEDIDITDRVLARLDEVLGAEDVPAHIPDAGPPMLPPAPLRPMPRPPSNGGPPLDLPAPSLEE